MGEEPDLIAVPGWNAWRRVQADDSGVLVDGASYFRALFHALRAARRYVLFSGWQFDRSVELLRGDERAPGHEVRLLPLLNRLCEANPALEVYMLAWDYHLIFALEREWMQRAFFHFATNGRVHFRFDEPEAAQSSHHQKFVVIDDALAFMGGLDLSNGRWDDRCHAARNPLRGRRRKPFHDVQAYLVGREPARALRALFADRWARTAGPPLSLPDVEVTPPAPFRPEGGVRLGPTTVTLSRTDARGPGQTVREIERLLADAIERAEQLIYIETQYLSSEAVCAALARRMRAPGRPRPEIVIVVNRRAEKPKEQVTVGLRQKQCLERLRATARDTETPLGLYYPVTPGPPDRRRDVYVHAKVMIVDDRFLSVGSANLTNRSLSVDTELQASWQTDAGGRELGRAIRRLRIGLLAEHTGLAGARLRALVRPEGLVARLEDLSRAEAGRLARHEESGAARTVLRDLVVPLTDPFDPARPSYDGRPEEDAEGQTPGWLARLVGRAAAALRSRTQPDEG